MKHFHFKAALIFVAILISFSGCKQSGTKKMTTSSGKDAIVEVGVFDPIKMKDQIVEAIHKFPPEKEVVKLINEIGISYIDDLTLSSDQYPKMLTQNQQSFGMGAFFFDWLYSTLYHRNDKAAEFGKLLSEMSTKMGLKDKMTSGPKYYDRISKNIDNKDSLDILISQDINYTKQQMEKEEDPTIFALSVIGANIEALHITFQAELLASDNPKLLDIINQQKERVATLSLLLEIMSGDNTIKPIYEEMIPVAQAFQGKEYITKEKINELAPKIEAIRSKFLQ
jgi:hypothetical protein